MQQLGQGVLFEHDPSEVEVWLESLPQTSNTGISRLLSFLDECFQRCNKTPYKYLEDSLSFFSSQKNSSAMDVDGDERPTNLQFLPSPLLFTLVEQLKAKIQGKIITPADNLDIVSFLRRLFVLLPGKRLDLASIERVVDLLGSIDHLPESVEVVGREIYLLRSALGFNSGPDPAGIVRDDQVWDELRISSEGNHLWLLERIQSELTDIYQMTLGTSSHLSCFSCLDDSQHQSGPSSNSFSHQYRDRNITHMLLVSCLTLRSLRTC